MIKDNNQFISTTANASGKRKYKDRSTADPGIPKIGFTKRRRRLRDGGKIKT